MRRGLIAAAAFCLLAASAAQAEKHFYIADHEVRKVLKIKEDGTLLWDVPNGNGHDVQVLPGGNVLLINGSIVQEVTPDKKVVWEVGRPVVQSAESAQRLANGHTVIADNGRMKVVELDKDKKLVWEFAVPNDNKRKTPTMRQVAAWPTAIPSSPPAPRTRSLKFRRKRRSCGNTRCLFLIWPRAWPTAIRSSAAATAMAARQGSS